MTSTPFDRIFLPCPHRERERTYWADRRVGYCYHRERQAGATPAQTIRKLEDRLSSYSIPLRGGGAWHSWYMPTPVDWDTPV